MTQDDIPGMAREAGFYVDENGDILEGDNYSIQTDLIERFAALIAAHEREKVARWQIGSGYTTGHGDTIEDLLVELEWQVRESEREACAKVAENRWLNKANCTAEEMYELQKQSIATAIRARGQK